MKTNLGIFGPAGSGKDIASKYLAKKYNYYTINQGNIVRALARKEKIKPTRENLERLQEKYSKKLGRDYVAFAVEKKLRSLRKPAILEGIRKPVQAREAKNKFGAKLILVDASPRIRFERMKKRRRSDFSKTFEDFLKVEGKEEKVFGLKKTFAYADFKVDNSKDKKHLFAQLDKVMKKIN